MRVVIVNFEDKAGGAARAAYRLHSALRSMGIESFMFVHRKQTDDPFVIGPTTIWQRFLMRFCYYLDAIPGKLLGKKGYFFNFSWVGAGFIMRKLRELNPDVVHLHWVLRGMMSPSQLNHFSGRVLWTCHDMWPFTGGCHYDEYCQQYESGCKACPMLKKPVFFNISRHLWRKKYHTYHASKVHFLGVSRWMSECIQRSNMVPTEYVHCLPNPINTSLFSPVNKEVARAEIGINSSQQIILFGAMDAFSEARKGFQYLEQALGCVNQSNILLITFGAGENQSRIGSLTCHHFGSIKDDHIMVMLYSAADILVLPSLQENLANTVMEAMACGTPCVAFDIGGNSDLITHKHNGYLAQPKDCEDLAKGMEWCLNPERLPALSSSAREHVLKHFEEKHVAKQYIDLYRAVSQYKNQSS